MIRQDEDMRRVDCESRREAADFAEFVKRVGHAAGISGKGPGSGTVLPGFCRDVAHPVVGGACRNGSDPLYLDAVRYATLKSGIPAGGSLRTSGRCTRKCDLR